MFIDARGRGNGFRNGLQVEAVPEMLAGRGFRFRDLVERIVASGAFGD